LETLTATPALTIADTRPAKLWLPRRVVFTPDALKEPFGQQIYHRVTALGLPVEEAKSNRITGLKGADERETYRNAKNTLAVVTAPPGAFRLQPIPPSADWQFHLAEGCPAHCQYCYLAGSLSGPPVIRTFANLPAILENTGPLRGTRRPHHVRGQLLHRPPGHRAPDGQPVGMHPLLSARAPARNCAG
jgi:spore photoproduct lyase